MNYNFLKEILQKIKFHEEKKELLGQNFNIFSIMSMESDEVFTHSALIAELLNPKGAHGLGIVPLNLFYKLILEKECLLSENEVICLKEEHVGFINVDGTEGGRLDIVLKNSQEQGFVIENKIYALEQENQLLRYKNRYPKADILYLTLEGEESRQLTSDDGIEYISISYKEDIVNWISECLKLAYDKPILRETLKQYLFLIKKLTNQTTDLEMQTDLQNIIKQNLVASAEIVRNFPIVLKKLKTEFLNDLTKNLEEKYNHYNISRDIINGDEAILIKNLPGDYVIKFRFKSMNLPVVSVTKGDLELLLKSAKNYKPDLDNEKRLIAIWKIFNNIDDDIVNSKSYTNLQKFEDEISFLIGEMIKK